MCLLSATFFSRVDSSSSRRRNNSSIFFLLSCLLNPIGAHLKQTLRAGSVYYSLDSVQYSRLFPHPLHNIAQTYCTPYLSSRNQSLETQVTNFGHVLVPLSLRVGSPLLRCCTRTIKTNFKICSCVQRSSPLNIGRTLTNIIFRVQHHNGYLSCC